MLGGCEPVVGQVQAGYEAWVDSGLDFTHLRGSSRVGVYVGACGSDAHGLWLTDVPSITGGWPLLQCSLAVRGTRGA